MHSEIGRAEMAAPGFKGTIKVTKGKTRALKPPRRARLDTGSPKSLKTQELG